MKLHNYYLFEQCVAKIFEEADYSTQNSAGIVNCKGDIDIVAEKNGLKYCVEVKYSLINNKAAERIVNIAKINNMKPVLVTAEYVTAEKRASYDEQFSELILVDISNLLYAVQNNEELRNELLLCLNYSVEGIEPREGFMETNSIWHNEYTKSLIKEIELCKTGKATAQSYEDVCYKLLENIFADDLVSWKRQKKSNKDLYRFDLICRIKDNNQKSFWSIMERFFNSKYVIFEFKNYTDTVTQNEIYTTEKYLYAKALRCVAIIISQNGYDDNARWAAKGCLRESGKLLILLETKDLIEMNKRKMRLENPSEYLLDKLDEILMELEK